MLWCPVCKSEYRDGFTKCSDCDVDLVEELSDEEKVEKADDEQVLLKNVENDFEAEIVQSLLKSYGIESIKIYKGAGDLLRIYMGSSNFGIDIYVHESKYEEAKNILDSKAFKNSESIDESQNACEKENFDEDTDIDLTEDKKRVLLRRFTALAFLLPTAVLIGISIVALIFRVINHFQ